MAVNRGTMAQPPDAVQARIAPYAGRTSLFLFGGITLIVANVALSQQGWDIARAIFPTLPASTPTTVGANSVSIVGVIGEAVLLGALLLVGSVSDEGATFALIFLAALWLLFLYNHRGLVAGFAGAVSSAYGPTGGGSATGGASNGAAPSAWAQYGG